MTWLEEERAARAQLDDQLGALRQDIRAISIQIAEVKSDLMKWSFVFWCGSVTAIAALAGVLQH